MSSAQIIFSPRALTDLKGIEDYVAEHDGESRAWAVKARLDKSLQNLAFMPGIGGRRSYLEDGMRAFAVSPWIIYYVPLREGDGIRVLRVIDGRRDLPAIFGKKR